MSAAAAMIGANVLGELFIARPKSGGNTAAPTAEAAAWMATSRSTPSRLLRSAVVSTSRGYMGPAAMPTMSTPLNAAAGVAVPATVVPAAATRPMAAMPMMVQLPTCSARVPMTTRLANIISQNPETARPARPLPTPAPKVRKLYPHSAVLDSIPVWTTTAAISDSPGGSRDDGVHHWRLPGQMKQDLCSASGSFPRRTRRLGGVEGQRRWRRANASLHRREGQS